MECSADTKYKIFQMKEGISLMKYCGSYINHGKLAENYQTTLIDKFMNKMQGWQKNLITQVGKT